MNAVQIVMMQEKIIELYRAAEIQMPSPDAPITPLGELVQFQNVTCTEIANLSIQTAMQHLLKRGGLSEAWHEVNIEPLAGFMYANSRWGSIFVEKTDRLTRRRFSIAHELGHYLLHFEPLLVHTTAEDEFIEAIEVFPPVDDESDTDSLPIGNITLTGISPNVIRTIEQMEREANQFAAELLMPAPVMQGLEARYASLFREEDLILRLASDLLVSRLAVKLRRRELGLTTVQQNLN